MRIPAHDSTELVVEHPASVPNFEDMSDLMPPARPPVLGWFQQTLAQWLPRERPIGISQIAKQPSPQTVPMTPPPKTRTSPPPVLFHSILPQQNYTFPSLSPNLATPQFVTPPM